MAAALQLDVSVKQERINRIEIRYQDPASSNGLMVTANPSNVMLVREIIDILGERASLEKRLLAQPYGFFPETTTLHQT